MTDVYIVTLSMIGILITSPGLAAAINLLAPRLVDRAYLRINQTPRRSFFTGLAIGGAILIWALVVTNLPFGGAQLLGFLPIIAGLAAYSVGAAAMSRLMAERIAGAVGREPGLGDWLKGALVLELACFTPLVGWFVFAPLVLSLNLGAALFALLGWAPKSRPAPPADDPTQTAAPTRTLDRGSWSQAK